MPTYPAASGSWSLHGRSVRHGCWGNVLYSVRTDAGVPAVHQLGDFPVRAGALLLFHQRAGVNHDLGSDGGYVSIILGRVQYYHQIHSRDSAIILFVIIKIVYYPTAVVFSHLVYRTFKAYNLTASDAYSGIEMNPVSRLN
jgi:hypothetical protein